MIRKILILISLGILIPFSSYTQIPLDNGMGYVVEAHVVNGDTLAHIDLHQVIIIPPRIFKNKKERNRYRRLIRYLKIVLPYARLAGEKFKQINAELDNYETKREKKKFINKVDKQLKAEFEGELRKLTISQGRLLIKLIDRETDHTTYQVVKQLKGSFSAFMYQSVARIFGSNLKTEFDEEQEDKYIEEIILLIDNGQL